MKRINSFLAIAASFVLIDTVHSGQASIYTSESQWLNAAGATATLEYPFSASDVLLANEVATLPTNGQTFNDVVLTFDATTTGYPISFVFRRHMLTSGHQIIFYTPPGRLGVAWSTEHDWSIDLNPGSAVTAIALNLSGQVAADSVRVYDEAGGLMGQLSLPGSEEFVGVVSQQPIGRILVDDSSSAGGRTIHGIALPTVGASCQWYCGSATNMDTYTVGAPYLLGGAFQGTVGFSAPNIGAVIAGYLGQLTFPIWGQQGLVNVGTTEVMGLPSGIGASPVVIMWAVPNEPAYVGFHVYSQAATFGGGQINLTCAYDCTVGY